MVNRFIRTHFQLLQDKFNILAVSLLLLIAIGVICFQTLCVIDLTNKNEKLSEEISEYRKTNNVQRLYIQELESSILQFEEDLSNLESEIAILEENLKILNDFKEQVNN